MIEVTSEIMERVETPAEPAKPKEVEDKIGLKVSDISNEMRQRLRLADDVRGLLVVTVKPGQAADNAGLQKGDLIVEVNRQPVSDAASFTKQIRSSPTGNVLLLYVLRENTYLFLTLEVQ
jgi:serine protease Do